MPNDTLPLVRGADAVVAALGRFDLHDALLRAVRIATDAANVPVLELDFELSHDDGAGEYRVTLHAADVSDVSLADFAAANVVADYTIAAAGVASEDGWPQLHVAMTCAPGCDLDFHCRTLAVRRVELIA